MDQRQLERIRLLSRHFHELQGWRVATGGALLTLGMVVYVIAFRNLTSEGALVALGLSFIPMAPAQWWLNRYYANNFGRQVLRRQEPFGSLVVPFLIVVIAGAYLNDRFPEIPPGAPTAATVAFISMWVAIRDWPWRGYYATATIAVAIAFTARATGAIEPGEAVAVTGLLTGVAMIAIGLLDHRLLVKLTEEARQLTGGAAVSARFDQVR